MIIHHRALIFVADGQKFLLLRNEGDLRHPLLVVEGSEERVLQPTSEQGSDQPGRSYASTGSRRSAVQQTDFQQLDKDRFAAEAAAILNKRAQAADFDELIVVAPPRTLAELRKNYGGPLSTRIVAEIDKDLTKHPTSQIAEILNRTE